MIRKILLVLMCVGGAGFLLAGKPGENVLKSSGSHISSTGAPGESTCAAAGCHDDATIDRDDNYVVTSLVLGNGEKTFKPATQHHLTLRAQKAGVNRFGFQIVALDTNNRSVGSFSLPVPQGAARVQLQSGTINKSMRYYVTHTMAGIQPTRAGEAEWRFLWTSPLDYSGKVTFYYCVNVTNTDDNKTGDHLYLGSPAFLAEGTTGVKETGDDVRLYPTIAGTHLTVERAAGFPDDAILNVVSLQGITLLKKSLASSGNSVILPVDNLPAGIYSAVISSGAGSSTRTFVIAR